MGRGGLKGKGQKRKRRRAQEVMTAVERRDHGDHAREMPGDYKKLYNQNIPFNFLMP